MSTKGTMYINFFFKIYNYEYNIYLYNRIKIEIQFKTENKKWWKWCMKLNCGWEWCIVTDEQCGFWDDKNNHLFVVWGADIIIMAVLFLWEVLIKWYVVGIIIIYYVFEFKDREKVNKTDLKRHWREKEIK